MMIPPLASLTLAEQVAQRMILGYPKDQTNTLHRFLQAGLGGVIFFRENFQGLNPQDPLSVTKTLEACHQQKPAHLPPLFLSLDQEGGHIERLPHTLFPTGINPATLALAHRNTDPADPKANEFAAEVYDLTAYYLSLLGFNMNFFPTLDVNLNPQNPVIGVRAFSDDPQTVWRFAQVALERFQQRGITAVGKHFPGHGNGTVDSHETLPQLKYTETECQPFQQAIQKGIPALMISHGYYPALQDNVGEQQCPASLSKAIIQNLLRTQLGFTGLTLSDDLCMGAIAHDPIETAFKAVEAGIDILLYREATDIQWEIHQALVKGLESGRLDLKTHEAAMDRLLTHKASLPAFAPNHQRISQILTPAAISSVSSWIASHGLVTLVPCEQGEHAILDPETLFWLVHPGREAIPQYRDDVTTTPDLSQHLKDMGIFPLYEEAYTPGQPLAFPQADPPDLLVFVDYMPQRYSEQTDFYNTFKAHYPEVPVIVVSAGLSSENLWTLKPNGHMVLASYRPESLKGLAEILTRQP